MRYSQKYPDDMVENLAESSRMCSDGPGVLESKSKGGGLFFERDQEREKGDGLLRFGKEEGGQQTYLLAT
jgi:hypothetical protein